MENEKLRSLLGDEGLAELVALVNKAPPIPVKPQPEWQKVVMAELKSFSNLFALALVTLPDVAPMILPQLEGMLDANTYKRVVNVIGIVILIRAKYKVQQAAQEKGTSYQAVMQEPKP
jgi:hypothetical protein